jgi:predicted site-specific integrase-resolvase
VARNTTFTKDLAAALGCSTQQVNRLAKRGKIEEPAMRVGYTRLWDEDQLKRIKKLAEDAA